MKIPGGSGKLISVKCWALRVQENDRQQVVAYHHGLKMIKEQINQLSSHDYEVMGDQLLLLTEIWVDITYKTKSGKTETKNLYIQPGMVWEASVPRWAQWAVGKPTDFPLESLVHDYLYEQRFYREVADDVFYYLLDKSGVRDRKVRWMFWAVRLGGFVYYASDTSKFWRFVRRLL